MKEIILVKSLLLLLISIGVAQEFDENLRISIVPKYGIDLSDSNTGKKESGERNWANTLGVGLEAEKSWYGISFLYRICQNTYNQNIGVFIDTLVPGSLTSHFFTGKIMIIPIESKNFTLSFLGGSSFAITNQMAYFYNEQQNKNLHHFLRKSGFGFSWGIDLGLSVTEKIHLTTGFSAEDFQNRTKVGTFFFLDFGLKCRIY